MGLRSLLIGSLIAGSLALGCDSSVKKLNILELEDNPSFRVYVGVNVKHNTKKDGFRTSFEYGGYDLEGKNFSLDYGFGLKNVPISSDTLKIKINTFDIEKLKWKKGDLEGLTKSTNHFYKIESINENYIKLRYLGHNFEGYKSRLRMNGMSA